MLLPIFTFLIRHLSLGVSWKVAQDMTRNTAHNTNGLHLHTRNGAAARPNNVTNQSAMQGLMFQHYQYFHLMTLLSILRSRGSGLCT